MSRLCNSKKERRTGSRSPLTSMTSATVPHNTSSIRHIFSILIPALPRQAHVSPIQHRPTDHYFNAHPELWEDGEARQDPIPRRVHAEGSDSTSYSSGFYDVFLRVLGLASNYQYSIIARTGSCINPIRLLPLLHEH